MDNVPLHPQLPWWLRWCRICLQCRFDLWVREYPLEKRMATHSSMLAREIPPTQEPGGLQSMGSQRVLEDWVTNIFTYFQCTAPSPNTYKCTNQDLNFFFYTKKKTLKIISFIYLFLAVLGLLWCLGFSPAVVNRGYPLAVMCGPLISLASLVSEHWLSGAWASVVGAPGLQSTGSTAAVHRLSCSKACGIFLDWTHEPRTGSQIVYSWATREAPESGP